MTITKFIIIIIFVGVILVLAIFLLKDGKQFILDKDGSLESSLGGDKTQVIAPFFDELRRQGISYERQLEMISDFHYYALQLDDREDVRTTLNDFSEQLRNDPSYIAAFRAGNDGAMQQIARSYLTDAIKAMFLPLTDRVQTIFVNYLLGKKRGARLFLPSLSIKEVYAIPVGCGDRSQGKPLPKPFDKWFRCPPADDSPFLGGGQLIGPGGITIDYGKAPGDGQGAIIRPPQRDIGVGLKIGRGNDIIPIIGGGGGTGGGYIGHRSDCAWFVGAVIRR